MRGCHYNWWYITAEKLCSNWCCHNCPCWWYSGCCNQVEIIPDELGWEGLTFHQTQYKSGVFMGQMTQPTVSKHWRRIGSKGRGFNPTRSTPLCCNNDICSMKKNTNLSTHRAIIFILFSYTKINHFSYYLVMVNGYSS